MDYNNFTNIPIVTYAVSAICVLVYLLGLMQTASLGHDPMPYLLGVSRSYVLGGQWWRLLTAGFVHLSFWHIAMNLSAFISMGQSMENNLGHARFGLLLFVCIVAGNIMVCLLAPHTLAAGLSTGLYGLMVFAIVRIAQKYGMEAITHNSAMVYTIFVNLVMNFLPGISWQGHLGGAIAGALLARIL
ncbi:MAG: rhomboid family intramembrane serine protease [Lactimicrobium sp.]|jgi:rhomboid protease GluP|uniref:rhomboid family intramembrane serine protease n=1 Tax=Lactimicrobium sp. TaxID=2563780 RepID=UPI002F3549AB